MDEFEVEEIEEVEIDEIEIEEDFQVRKGSRRKLEGPDRKSLPTLGRKAMAKLIGVRAKQLETGSPSVIPRTRLKSVEPEKIANQELIEKVLPLKLVRYFPDNTYEEWRISEIKYFAKR